MQQTGTPRPPDATLSVTRAARLLGVHPNTVRAWSDQGRLRYYRINRRGDRRYRLGDLQRFLAGAQPSPDGPATSGHDRASADHPDQLRTRATGLPPELTAPHPDLELMARLATVIATGRELEATLAAAVRILRDGWGLAASGVWERIGGHLVPRAMAGVARPFELSESFGILGRALETDGAVLLEPGATPDTDLIVGRGPELAAPIAGRDGAWGVLWLAADGVGGLTERELGPTEAAADVVAAAIRAGRLADEVAHQLHRADALRRVADDIGGRLDLDQILGGLVDHAMVLFEADRAAVYLRQSDGRPVATVSRGLSSNYLTAACGASPSLALEATSARRPVFAIGYRDDPRATAIRAAVVQEGFDTLCTAPLVIGDRLLGSLDVHHDTPHPWSAEELETMRAFAAQASVAIKAAQDVAQMATWAAQLQSIQQLGTRLNRLTSVREIGMAIATELRQLLDYHNVRVYRVRGPELVPVAMLGRVGEYEDETPEMLSVRVGEGITGWVAQHGIAQYLPDAAHDARARTIPGTDSDLAESMLLAPMVFEDQVLGVVVLSKLGLGQFSDDDLRLLVIYASFAAQAMANADATEVSRAQSEALERQLLRQRELLELTESMLTILDPDALLEEVTRRLAALVACDNVFVDLLDRGDGRLRPIRALGPDAEAFLADREERGVGVAAWVAERNVPLLIADERDDPRVRHLGSTGPHDGSLIVVPLRDRGGVSGVLTIERIAPRRPFSTDESELVQLFAAQVSIALQNATVHSAVEVRARTDALTGLLNHGAFEAWLAAAVAAGSPFSLIMVDLDDFKAANDALGHQTGDDVLRSAATAITRSTRSTDPVFRYGGDEFIVCLPGDLTAAVPAAADRIRRSVSAVGDEPPWRARGVRLGTSIGYASFPADGQTAAEILLAADRACYVAKRSGRGLIVTAATGRELAADSALQEPTPVDPPTSPPAGDATS